MLQVSERNLDLVIDHLNDLNDETPRLRCSGRNGVPPSLIFGLDSKLYLDESSSPGQREHHEEVETVTVLRGPALHRNTAQDAGRDRDHDHDHDHAHATDSFPATSAARPSPVTRRTLDAALAALSKESVWRVKGFVKFTHDSQVWILNWAFGRHELTSFGNGGEGGEGQVQLTVMGARGDMRTSAKRFASAVGGELS
jgi:G3E family GTPase